jgi:hypothetical protein
MNALYDFTNVKTDIAVKVIDAPAVIFEKFFL